MKQLWTENEKQYIYLINCIDASGADKTATVSITGGTFYGADPTGGDNSKNPNCYLADGYKVTESTVNGVKTYTVVPSATA